MQTKIPRGMLYWSHHTLGWVIGLLCKVCSADGFRSYGQVEETYVWLRLNLSLDVHACSMMVGGLCV